MKKAKNSKVQNKAFVNVGGPIYGRNPVARAVARDGFRGAMRDFQIRVRMMPDGANAAADVSASIKIVAVCMMAMEESGHGEHTAMNVMRGARSALVACAKRGGEWKAADASAIDAGLKYVMDIYPQLPAEAVNWAFWTFRQYELESEQDATAAAAPAVTA